VERNDQCEINRTVCDLMKGVDLEGFVGISWPWKQICPAVKYRQCYILTEFSSWQSTSLWYSNRGHKHFVRPSTRVFVQPGKRSVTADRFSFYGKSLLQLSYQVYILRRCKLRRCKGDLLQSW